jgi:hypothetical protein
MNLNFREFRLSPSDTEWELPKWGHPISQGVMPLLIGVDGKLIPVGTIFIFGKIQFMISASHNVFELLKHDPRFTSDRTKIEGDGNHKLSKNLSLYALHQKNIGDENVRVTLIPLSKINIATPTDMMTATAQFSESLQTLPSSISFKLPSIGENVFSVGYSEFHYPHEGIDLDLVKTNRFNWLKDYNHKLFVIEGQVERLFTQKFSSGFVNGPCFSFTGEIRHAMSGGPIFNSAGHICGLNTAGGSSFFNKPTSLGSLLYPLLGQSISFGAKMGPVQFNATHKILDLVAQGSVITDGSECEIALTESAETGRPIIHPRSSVEDAKFIHDDFTSYQKGITASRLTGERYVLKKNPG